MSLSIPCLRGQKSEVGEYQPLATQNYSVWGKEDGAAGGPDGSRCPSQKGGRQCRSLKDGGVGARVERDGRNRGGGERRGDEGWGDGFHEVLLKSKLSLNTQRDNTFILERKLV